MIYYNLKAGVKGEIQLFDPDGGVIEIFDHCITEDKTFNETWLVSKWDCSCCDSKLMSFYMGSFELKGMEVRQCVVVSEHDVAAGPRSSVIRKLA